MHFLIYTFANVIGIYLWLKTRNTGSQCPWPLEIHNIETDTQRLKAMYGSRSGIMGTNGHNNQGCSSSRGYRTRSGREKEFGCEAGSAPVVLTTGAETGGLREPRAKGSLST